MKNTHNKITIHDLAKDLSLSPGTVSKILNGKGNISTITRDRVLNKVKEIGYVASHSARILKATHSWTIGIVFADIALFGLEHPFFGSIIQAFKNFMEEQGYEIVFIPKKLGNQQQTFLQWARNKQVDGVLLLTGDINDQETIELVASGIPCVSTDMIMDGLSTVISDDEEGIRLVFNHFYNKGCRKIYALSGSTLSRAYQHRTESYQALIKEYRLPSDATWYLDVENYGFDAYYQASLQWIDTWKEKPEAIICFSDDIAMGLIRALLVKGFRVPQDISISGYDDITFARLFTPALTTIKQQKKLIAETAAKKLLEMIQQGDTHHSITKIPVQLILRDSTFR
jgi:DNA-binding LacI/PurR family transcriptional regulator